MTPKQNITDVDSYISGFLSSTQKVLQQVRSIIKKVAPHAEEGIGYQMPVYKLNGKPLVYFAGYENHIGLYPTPSGIEAFQKELSIYKNAKGSVQFPLKEKLPVALITAIVKFRVAQSDSKSKNNINRNPFSSLGAPAQRALENHGIKSVKQLSKFTEKEVLKLHGMGKSSIPKLKDILEKEGLSFKQ